MSQHNGTEEMAMPEESGSKREIKLTERAIEAKRNQQKNARKAKLKQMTLKRNHLESLMLDYANVDIVEQAYDVFCDIVKEFAELQSSIQRLLPEEKRDSDLNDWYLPQVGKFKEFRDILKKWLREAAMHAHQITETYLSPIVDTTMYESLTAMSVGITSKGGNKSVKSTSSSSSKGK